MVGCGIAGTVARAGTRPYVSRFVLQRTVQRSNHFIHVLLLDDVWRQKS